MMKHPLVVHASLNRAISAALSSGVPFENLAIDMVAGFGVAFPFSRVPVFAVIVAD